jgi:hypothetical protein
MKRKAGLPVLRQVWVFVAVLLASALGELATSQAAELAESAVIGYSVDGRYFAFEEFGIQDGSGFAYSNLFVIDLERDRWVPGTPVRRRGLDETERLFDVRAEAMAEAQPIWTACTSVLPTARLPPRRRWKMATRSDISRLIRGPFSRRSIRQ